MNIEYDYHKLPEEKHEYELWMNKFAQQEIEAYKNDVITCICDQVYEIKYLYRCYFCGLWLCPKCAKKHFGERPKGKYIYKDYFKGDSDE